nr:MAG TPA: hypothetical protein [Caudoviricetes sp.]
MLGNFSAKALQRLQTGTMGLPHSEAGHGVQSLYHTFFPI